MPSLYLIDGHAQFFRAYYAMRTALTSPVTGEPTFMVSGFTGTMLKLLRDHRPDYLAVVIDVAGDQESFRSEIYEDYKANREEAPDDFGGQVDRCLEVLDALAIPVLGEERVEADDVIASLVTQLRSDRPELLIRIVSRDKDLTQLVGEGVDLFDAQKDAIVEPSDVFKVEGVEASMVGDILALMGDTSDNIPGVPGIGPKTAAQLIIEYGTIDAVYEHLEDLTPKRRENLAANRDQVDMSRQLVELVRDLDVELDLEEAIADPSSWDVTAVTKLFRELGFNRHLEEAQRLAGATTEAAKAAPSEGRRPARSTGTLFDSGPDRDHAAYSAGYELVTTQAALDEVLARATTASRFAIDTETDGLDPRTANLCGVSISVEAGHGAYIPVRSPDLASHLDQESVIAALRPLLEDASLLKIGHNIKFDVNILRRAGAEFCAPVADTMLAAWLVDASRSGYGMDALALGLLEYDCIPISDLIGRGKDAVTFDTIDLDDAHVYAAEDADITLRLWERLCGDLEGPLRGLFDDVECPLIASLADMEWAGVRVDPAELDRQRQRLVSRIEELKVAIGKAAPHPFNPDSPKQLGVALFSAADADPPGLGLKVIKRGKTGPSTDQEVLERLDADPNVETTIPRLVLEHRLLSKLVSTYLVALKEAINPQTGRVHASFHQTGTATGRLSSSDPNLQNIPIRSEVGREIRRAFVAEEGHVLVCADYSQVELRVLAHLSGDVPLIAAFHAGEDIHRIVAAEVFGTPLDEISDEQRSAAKMVNFGIIYGVTPWGLARRLGDDVPNERAAAIIDDYKARFPGIDRFLRRCVHDAENDGYVETILKRRRPIPQVHSSNPAQRARAERIAINTVVQGSAADLIKLAMLALRDRIGELPGAKLVLQVHDELVLETPQECADATRDLLVEVMEGAMDLSVPLRADAAVSACWKDAK